MSPEQARGRPAEIGPPSDVYSLGVILYRLATGRLPFEGTVMEVLANAQFAEPEPPSSVRVGLDPRLDLICSKAMAKNPDDRYLSAIDLAGALGDIIRILENSDSPSMPVNALKTTLELDLAARDFVPASAGAQDVEMLALNILLESPSEMVEQLDELPFAELAPENEDSSAASLEMPPPS